MSKTIELTRSEFAENFLYLNGEPLSLDEYPFLRQIYDSDAKDKVMKFSRQCVADKQPIELSSGETKLAEDLQPGDPIIGFNTKTLKNEVTRIQNVWDNGKVPLFLVKTRMGHRCVVTHNHPFWKIEGWCDAENLTEGDRIAVSWDNSCSLPKENTVDSWKYKIAAYLLAEGAISNHSLGFTSSNKKSVEELQGALKTVHPDIKLKALPQKKYPHQYRINGLGSGYPHPVKKLLKSWGIYGHTSASKFHPDFVWDLTEKQIKDYLRIWWNCDGYITTTYNGTYEIGISLISKKLIKGIRSLLLKLGIPSRVCTEVPKVYKGTGKKVYNLYVIGQLGVRKFIETIDTYKAPLNPTYNKSNGKPFFYDKDFIYPTIKNAGLTKLGELFYKRKNNVSLEKLKRMYDESGLEKFGDLLKADHYYDEVTQVTRLGKGSSTGIEIEKTKNFYIDNIATKNTSKSTSLANMIITDMATIDNYKILFVSPSVAQTKLFSNDRVKPVIMQSPLIKNFYYDAKVTTQNVFEKEFLNGSKSYFRYVYLDAERIRGISSDCVVWDETQDIISDLIPVVHECMSRSEYKRTIFAGTPKLSQGTLAERWFDSTMYEYAIRCEGCNKWNILGAKNIGAHGLICSRCGSELSPYEDKGQWVSTYPDPQQIPDREGYRLCSLHFADSPWIDWQKDIITKMENYSKGYFYNEVLGLEHDSGSIPITRRELIKACNADLPMTEEPGRESKGRNAILAVDWGPVNSEKSYTCAVVIQQRPEYLQVVYAKRFVGDEADYSFIQNEMPRLMEKWNCGLMVADHGMGESINSILRDKLGKGKLLAMQHLPTQKERVRWQAKLPAYTLNKNQVTGEFFKNIKKGEIRFPSAETFDMFLDEIMNIQLEHDEKHNKLRYVSAGIDDFAQACIYGMVAAEPYFNIKKEIV